MFQTVFEEIVRFASEGDLAPQLATARQEYEQRTGQLLESDDDFERRIAAFLEWYVLDRPLDVSGLTPAHLFADASGLGPDDPKQAQLAQIAETTLSLFEFRKLRNDRLVVTDILANERHDILERRRLAGVEAGDILEARLIAFNGNLVFSDTWTVHPRSVRASIQKAAKRWRKTGCLEGSQTPLDRIGFVHRVAYLANRSQRYKHVDPQRIFAELAGGAAAS